MAGRTCEILVGTSGYSYAEWTAAGFYPPGMKQRDMIAFYARRFPAVELNFTWYQMPKADALDRMRRQVPPSFCFAVKLNRTLTHEVSPDGWRGDARRFREGVAPLVQSGQLGAVLVQLPPSFHRSPDHRRYLAALLDALDGLPLAVEFRHASWAAGPAAEKVAARPGGPSGRPGGRGRALACPASIPPSPWRPPIWSPTRGSSTSASTAGTPPGGAPAACSSSSTTTTARPSCRSGRMRGSPPWPTAPPGALSSSTTTSGARPPGTPRR